jgi:putative heme-binding domain-containing protein
VLVSVIEEPEPVAGVAALKGMLRGMVKRSRLPEPEPGQPTLAQASQRLAALAINKRLPLALRGDAIEVTSYLPDAADQIISFLERDHDQVLRIQAINAVARQPVMEPLEPLLEGIQSETPPVRRAIIDAFLMGNIRTNRLLDAIEAGKIKPSELDAGHVSRLSQHREPAIKARAAKLFAAATPAERTKALAEYQPVLGMPADAKRGQAVFEKNCAACHKVGGVGVNVAPDISDSRTKKLDQLLGDILLPNRAIDNNYVGYNVRLLDGTIATGILSAETSTSITLRQQGGKEAVISRDEIDELKSSGLSLMPEGLEKQIPHQDMADLLSFIKNWRYLDGRTPLGSN